MFRDPPGNDGERLRVALTTIVYNRDAAGPKNSPDGLWVATGDQERDSVRIIINTYERQ